MYETVFSTPGLGVRLVTPQARKREHLKPCPLFPAIGGPTEWVDKTSSATQSSSSSHATSRTGGRRWEQGGSSLSLILPICEMGIIVADSFSSWENSMGHENRTCPVSTTATGPQHHSSRAAGPLPSSPSASSRLYATHPGLRIWVTSYASVLMLTSQ